MRLIDADALLNEVFERHCKNCNKRKGVKNGAYRIIYEIGEAPCRACEIDDITDYLEEAPTVDAVEVIKCKDCKHWKDSDGVYRRGLGAESKCPINIKSVFEGTFYCGMAERRKDGTACNNY